MVVLIDGYNLIGTERGNLEAAREALIGEITKYRSRTGHDITLVFDGYIDGGYGSSTLRGGVRVVYTGIGEKADQAILRMLRRGVEAAVISSDREVQAGAWEAGAVAVDSETFWGKLSGDQSEGGAYPDEDEEYEELYQSQRKKGNPRKASKKQKALERMLKKL